MNQLQPVGPITKTNIEERINQDRMRRLQHRQQELKHKFKSLDSISVSPGPDRKEIEKIKGELENLNRLFYSLSPKHHKKEYQSASEIQEKYYDPAKEQSAKQFIENMHKDWEEYEKKKKAREAEKEKKHQEKMEKIRLEMEEAKKQENEQRRKKLEEHYIMLQQRQEHRKRLQAEWTKAYHEYLKKKPLYKIKEETYNEILSKLREENLKWLEQRRKTLKPESDYLFKDHQVNFKKKLEERKMENEKKRQQEKKEVKLPDLYIGKFHSNFDEEEKKMKQAAAKRFDEIKEQFEKRINYARHVKETIKVKTKPLSLRIEPASARKHISVQKSLEARELYNMGLKYLDFSKKRIKKKPLESVVSDAIQDTADDGKTVSDVKSSDNILHIQYPKGVESEKATPLGQSKSAGRIDYLPLLKSQHQAKGIKKKPDWIKIMNADDIKQQEKFELVKLNIQQYEENAKRIETRLKYAGKNSNIDDQAGELDEYYLNSAKAKLALLQNV